MEKYYLNYEGTRVDFALPQGWNVLTSTDRPPIPGVADPAGEIARALDNPICSPPIEEMARPGMEAVILFDDRQRPTPAHLAMPIIMNRLNKGGIRDEQIRAVCALGTHPALTIDQLKEKVGIEAYNRLEGRVTNHDPHSHENIVIGKTHRGTRVEVNQFVAHADLIIGIGECMPHPNNGFGGGCKIIMPGVCSYSSVADHHFSWMRHRHATVNMLDGNPFYEEICDAGRLARLAFKLDFIINEKREVIKAFAGDPVAEHKEASQFAASLYYVPVPKLSDVTITSASPLEIGVQATKALLMGSYCTRQGGTIIWLASQKQAGPILPLIEAMAGPESANEFHRKLIQGDIPDHLKVFGISYIMQVVFYKELSEKFHVIHVTEGLTPEQVNMMGFIYFKDLAKAIQYAHGRVPEADVTIFPSGGNSIPGVGQNFE
jgi:nickel-dependent lactate racemase